MSVKLIYNSSFHQFGNKGEIANRPIIRINWVQTTFFSKGLKIAVFQSSENTPLSNDKLTIFVRIGINESTWSFNICVGKQSSSYDLLCIFPHIFLISSSSLQLIMV